VNEAIVTTASISAASSINLAQLQQQQQQYRWGRGQEGSTRKGCVLRKEVVCLCEGKGVGGARVGGCCGSMWMSRSS
jgi:hypothetical protein